MCSAAIAVLFAQKMANAAGLYLYIKSTFKFINVKIKTLLGQIVFFWKKTQLVRKTGEKISTEFQKIQLQ